jgi:3-dehydroquinate synthase
MTTVNVELGARRYPIVIGAGWHERLGELLAPHFPPRPCTVVTNAEIARLWGDGVLASLAVAGYRPDLCIIPDGETHKTIETVTAIHDHMLAARHTRQSGVVALGGGIVGDIAGFAAATLLRGVAFIQLPTTLLAMVDSSVGGKTGVNHAVGKNLIGAFWQPQFVGAELEFLSSLPEAELRSGLAEVIKHGVILDAAFFEFLERDIELAVARDAEVLTHCVRRSCELKAQVVAADERELSGLRAVLNFGHTFGHAAESLGGYAAIRHGEGVAMGMVAAAQLAANRGLCGAELPERIAMLCRRAGLPTQLLKYSAEDYWRKMGSDKKVKDGRIHFVLPTRMGEVQLVNDVTRDEADAVLATCMEQ